MVDAAGVIPWLHLARYTLWGWLLVGYSLLSMFTIRRVGWEDSMLILYIRTVYKGPYLFRSQYLVHIIQCPCNIMQCYAASHGVTPSFSLTVVYLLTLRLRVYVRSPMMWCPVANNVALAAYLRGKHFWNLWFFNAFGPQNFDLKLPPQEYFIILYQGVTGLWHIFNNGFQQNTHK